MKNDHQLAGLPPAVQELVEKFAAFPGIGKKSAIRMALYILKSQREYARSLSDAIIAVKDRISFCRTCWTLSESNPCPICSNPRRDQGKICVVEESGDILAFERTDSWEGVYHVLGGALSPLDGIGPEQLRFNELKNRILNGSITEIVVATNPTSEGETTALYIARMCKPLNVRVTRIARGIPVGSDIELVDDSTLQQSLKGRAELLSS